MFFIALLGKLHIYNTIGLKKQDQHILHEPAADYEKAELDLLKTALKRSYTERFHAMTKLMKMNLMFRQAVIRHKPLSSSE